MKLTEPPFATVSISISLSIARISGDGLKHYFGRFICAAAFHGFVVCNMGIAELAVEE
jgi:hypothetical protein